MVPGASLFYFLYFAAGVQTASPNIVMDTYTWSATVDKLYTFIFNFNYDTTPLWYVYMLVGLYLFMPIMSAWLTRPKEGREGFSGNLDIQHGPAVRPDAGSDAGV